MRPNERLLATLRGQPHDRIAIYTQIPFGLEVGGGFCPAAFHGYGDYDDWRRRDPAYWRLVRRMESECDNFFIWRPPCMVSDQFFVPDVIIRSQPAREENGRIVTTSVLKTGGRELRTVRAVQPGTGHTWVLEHYCQSPQDAQMLLELPWQSARDGAGDFSELSGLLGDRGVMWATIPSPILVVCRLFEPMEFLVFVRTERDLLHRLLAVAAERIATNLTMLLRDGVGPIVRFGGAEHATPPLMSPADFDDLVVRYDKPLMDLAKRHGCHVAVHCHGKIRHALRRFVEMGVDQTDPVEADTDGDLTLAEARRIAQGRVTLTGNIQMRELATATPDAIRQRVMQIAQDAGPDHLIFTTTGTPLEPISQVVEANYHAFIDAAVEFGRL
jgi:hypothetical protein